MAAYIFCPDNDLISFSVYTKMKKDKADVELVTEKDLVFAKIWKHEITENGNVSTTIVLSDGRIIISSDIQYLFNRILSFQMLHFTNANDRSYAAMEQTALYTSFVKSINAVLFEPFVTEHLSAYQNNIWRVYQCAVDAGFPVADLHYTSAPRKYPAETGKVLSYDGVNCPVQLNRNSFINLNQPVFSTEPFEKKISITVVNNQVFGTDIELDKTSIENFSHLINKIFYELLIGTKKDKYFFINANLYPVTVTQEVVNALSENIKLKIP